MALPTYFFRLWFSTTGAPTQRMYRTSPLGRTMRLVASKGEAFAESPLIGPPRTRDPVGGHNPNILEPWAVCGWERGRASEIVPETSSRIRQDRRPSYPCGQAAALRRDRTRFFAVLGHLP